LGVEGIYKSCCETILDLLKNAQHQIMTIFEVLLYDPLHNWSISPKKAYMLQQVDSFTNATVLQSTSSSSLTICDNDSVAKNTSEIFNLENENTIKKSIKTKI
jgi:phosphatidylinositol kinase/protein kinase (PI-3  family)